MRNRIGVCCVVNSLCSFVVIRKTAVVVPVPSLFLVTTPAPPLTCAHHTKWLLLLTTFT